jgi:hypothetical protein
MKTIEPIEQFDLPSLVAQRRSPEIPEAMDIYGWLVGSWELEVRHYWVDVRGRNLKGEVHFAWALEGRAVQDVWIMPRRSDRKGELDMACNMYGTTLRVWDAGLQAWRVTWFNPVTGARCDLIGRWSGKDIVQVGALQNGTPIRWKFTEITPHSFRWTGEMLKADGESWELQGDFCAKRMR